MSDLIETIRARDAAKKAERREYRAQWMKERRAAFTPQQRRRVYDVENTARRFKRGEKMREFPFCGVDGEGGGKDELGRQNYILLRAGDNLLFDNNRRLSTEDCLAFLSGLPTDRIYVAYYYDYDVSMILRDTTPQQRERVLKPRIIMDDAGPKVTRVTYIGDYMVEYLPRKYFKVKHKDQKHWVEISECGPFFQCSFHKAITDWNIGTEEQRDKIAAGKLARRDFELMTETEIEYNRLECEFLVELMTSLRQVCIDTDIVPRRWQGPGFLASKMFQTHNIPKRKDIALPKEIWPYANNAYYGGRTELFKIGNCRDVYEYDINSAYPTAMLTLPCVEHGSWEYRQGKPQEGALYVADIQFYNNANIVCNLPIRDPKRGHIFWPKMGNGIYWSCEIEAAQRARTVIKEWRNHWVYHKQCDCIPFTWLDDVYRTRKALGKGTKGYALKLAINSLYGKTAQSIGSAPYANPVWAGLITAQTRAMLIDAYRHIDQASLVMLATDGVYTLEPLSVNIGDWLGQWEMKQHSEIFFVQPGVYFYANSKRPKTRGVPMTALMKEEQRFRDLFAEWKGDVSTFFGERKQYPFIEIDLHAFIGIKLAQLWRKPDLAGRWMDVKRQISFDFRNKRMFCEFNDDHIYTLAKFGSADLRTAYYSKDIGRWREDEELDNALFHAQPDLFPMTERDLERV